MSVSTPHAPLVVWLGDAPPQALGVSSGSFCRIHLGWAPGASLVLAWASSGTDTLRALPPLGRRPRVIATAGGPPSVRERLSWIRAGADDLVPIHDLPGAVVRHLFPDGNIPVLASEPDTETAGLRLIQDGSTWPPVLLPAPEPDGPAHVWAGAMARYLAARNTVAAELGPNGAQRLQELLHLRERAAAALDPNVVGDPFGQRRSSAEPPLGWPAAVRRAEQQGGGAEIWESTAIGIGSEGLIVSLQEAVDPGQRLIVDVAVQPGLQAQLLAEARWQRRVSRQIWHVGALALSLELRAVPEP
ncbi:MAG: hypothetical protein IPG17_29710 [Sandaracinaceae bacterium]|nr:hypothetical protein [Sandaracinaceae bacterium]